MSDEENIPDAKISPDQQKTVDKFLMQAVAEYKYERINLTLRKGANIDTQGENGYTPLMLAVTQGSAYLVKFILNKNPDMFVKDNWKRTAFDLLQHVSSVSERDEMTDAMLAALPDRIRKTAPGTEEAIRMAAEEIAAKKPVDLVAPDRASFPPKHRGFQP